MTKRRSEYDLGAALRGIDDDPPIFVYKPADTPMAANWRPCDYMVWLRTPFVEPVVAWFEAKDSDAVRVFNLKLVRPSQRRGIEEAKRIGIPYWLAIHWSRYRDWTISDATRLRFDVPSVTRELLSSKYGVDSSPAQLTSTLRLVLLGELGR